MDDKLQGTACLSTSFRKLFKKGLKVRQGARLFELVYNQSRTHGVANWLCALCSHTVAGRVNYFNHVCEFLH